MKKKQHEVAIIKCGYCGKLGISINDTRITSHKCSGAFDFVHTEKVDLWVFQHAEAFVPRPRKGKK